MSERGWSVAAAGSDATRGFARATRAGGLLFVGLHESPTGSGTGAWAHAQEAFKLLTATLEAAGASPERVTLLRVTLARADDAPEVLSGLKRLSLPPAPTVEVLVAALPGGGRVGLAAIATVAEGGAAPARPSRVNDTILE